MCYCTIAVGSMKYFDETPICAMNRFCSRKKKKSEGTAIEAVYLVRVTSRKVVKI